MSGVLKFKKILVTGGAGFIGSAFVKRSLKLWPTLEKVVNLDLLTYAGNINNISSCMADPRHLFIQGDIQDTALVHELCEKNAIEAIIHFAAESHVDRSIAHPSYFIDTNVGGTFSLLEVVRAKKHIHFHHISTDEVYGSIEEGFFTETSPYQPNSPYAASKAASDHLVRAWANTYNLSTTISHCSNNYGPGQHEEKFIPRMISRYLQGLSFTIYGNGLQVRDWLYVEDHVDALWLILNKAKKGSVYNIGGNTEKKNLDLLHLLLEMIAKKAGQDIVHLKSKIQFVEDRPGDDFRYAIDATKISTELEWQPRHSLLQALDKTVDWYLESSLSQVVKP